MISRDRIYSLICNDDAADRAATLYNRAMVAFIVASLVPLWLRALRAFKLIRYSRSAQALLSAITNQRQQLFIVLLLSLAYTATCAIVIFNVEPGTFPSIFDALYWSVVSLTTVGYGDLYPVSDAGRAIAMASSFMGIAIVALPSGIITTGLLEKLKEEE